MTAPNLRATTTLHRHARASRGRSTTGRPRCAAAQRCARCTTTTAWASCCGSPTAPGTSRRTPTTRWARRTSTTTPDGGVVEFGYDAEGKQISKVTPNLRADRHARSTTSTSSAGCVEIDYPRHRPTCPTPTAEWRRGQRRRPGRPRGGRLAHRDERLRPGRRASTSQLTEMKYHDWTTPRRTSRRSRRRQWELRRARPHRSRWSTPTARC